MHTTPWKLFDKSDKSCKINTLPIIWRRFSPGLNYHQINGACNFGDKIVIEREKMIINNKFIYQTNLSVSKRDKKSWNEGYTNIPVIYTCEKII